MRTAGCLEMIYSFWRLEVNGREEVWELTNPL